MASSQGISPSFISSSIDWSKLMGCVCFPPCLPAATGGCRSDSTWEVPSTAQVGGAWGSSSTHERPWWLPCR